MTNRSLFFFRTVTQILLVKWVNGGRRDSVCKFNTTICHKWFQFWECIWVLGGNGQIISDWTVVVWAMGWQDHKTTVVNVLSGFCLVQKGNQKKPTWGLTEWIKLVCLIGRELICSETTELKLQSDNEHWSLSISSSLSSLKQQSWVLILLKVWSCLCYGFLLLVNMFSNCLYYCSGLLKVSTSCIAVSFLI